MCPSRTRPGNRGRIARGKADVMCCVSPCEPYQGGCIGIMDWPHWPSFGHRLDTNPGDVKRKRRTTASVDCCAAPTALALIKTAKPRSRFSATPKSLPCKTKPCRWPIPLPSRGTASGSGLGRRPARGCVRSQCRSPENTHKHAARPHQSGAGSRRRTARVCRRSRVWSTRHRR